MKILIVDDEKNFRESLRGELENAGCGEVFEASNWKEAEEAVKSKSPDLVFLDVMLPDKSGTEVFHSLKHISLGLDIIMMSGNIVDNAVQEVLDKGGFAYLRKPFDIDHAISAINKIREKKKVYNLFSSKDYVSNIIKSMIDSMIVLSPEGMIQMVNRATLDLLGYQESELIGMPIDKILPQGFRSLFGADQYVEIVSRGYIQDYNISYKTREGKLIPISFSGSIMRDKNKKIIGIVCVAKDMREELQLIEALKEKEQDLQDKVDKLERFQRVTIDRELEMKALEQRVQELESKQRKNEKVVQVSKARRIE